MSVNEDTKYYYIALTLWKEKHPRKRELSMTEMSKVLAHAARLKNWYAGLGCSKHKLMRSGSCHECAMLQPKENL